MKILVIGDSCVDKYVYTTSSRLSPEAPVPVLNPIRIVENPGMAGNVVVNLEKLGVDVDIITNTSKITKTRFVDEHTNQMFIRYDENDTAEHIKNKQLSDIDFKIYDAIIISDYNKGFLNVRDIEYVANNHELTFMDTKKLLGKWGEILTFIKLNSYEYDNYLIGSSEYSDFKIMDNIIVTLGKHGCKFKGKSYPVDEVKIKDLSGSGDTFLAGLVVEYLKTNSINKALKFANECATIVVQKRGVCTV